MLKVIGIFSYGAAFALCAVDMLLFGMHQLLRGMSNKFLADGDSLTGWQING